MSLIHSAPVAMFRPAGVALICPPQTLKKWGECFDCLDWQADFSATRLGPDDEWALASLFVPGNTKGTDEWARERGVDYRLAQTPTRLSRYAAEPPSTLHVIAVPRERVGVHVCSCPAHHLTHRAGVPRGTPVFLCRATSGSESSVRHMAQPPAFDSPGTNTARACGKAALRHKVLPFQTADNL